MFENNPERNKAIAEKMAKDPKLMRRIKKTLPKAKNQNRKN